MLQSTKEELVEEIKNSIIEEIKILFERNKTEDDHLLTRKEVCQYFHIHESTLNRWTKSGKLTGRYVGNKIYYKSSEVYKLPD